MNVEGLIVLAVLVGALLPLLLAILGTRAGLLKWGFPILVAGLGGALFLVDGQLTRPRAESEVLNRPVEDPSPDYVSSKTCRSCHPHEHSSWRTSFHSSMTQVVSSRTVAGGFDGRQEDFYGWRFSLERRGDEYWAEIGDTGKPRGSGDWRRLILSTGSHHMQKYWYSIEGGRKLGLFPLVYLIESDKWVPVHTAFIQPPNRGMPVGHEGRWNSGCNQCHATGSRPRLHEPGKIDTRVAEFGIACESCHGPAEEHVRLNRDPLRRYSYHGKAKEDDTIVNPSRLSPKLSAQVCGQCHGVWTLLDEGRRRHWREKGHEYRPGDNLHDSRQYLFHDSDSDLLERSQARSVFWPGGMLRVTGREYNALLKSPCYAGGEAGERTMTCSSCHSMHQEAGVAASVDEWADDQLSTGMRSNEACLQCHPGFRKDIEAHTHHAADSTGSNCYNCHMPHTSLGLLKGVRSHTISSPAAKVTGTSGKPNACNLCHLDKTLDWTAGKLAEWYGQSKPVLDTEDRSIAASVLWAMRGDAAQRALAAWSMGWKPALEASDPDWMVYYLVQLMFDSYDAIRYISYRSLRRQPGFSGVEFDHMETKRYKDSVNKVLNTWFEGERVAPEAALYDPGGRPRLDIIQKLMSERDSRPITITE
ncbi:MAG: multiheme c-type cytochrome [Planctomycetota bacterium]|nr:multiheme c-type cytochrome [Planctomycetota bacterium]